MDRVTCCLQCGKRMVPARSLTGRTEMVCVFSDKLDPMEMEKANKWAESPLAQPISERAPLNELCRSRPSDVISWYSTSSAVKTGSLRA